jgi:N-acetylglucosaminyl-diphospho-decaprenol L-rhamnosyltransferase
VARLDVVVVSFNSRGELRRCVAPLTGHPDVRLTVVDNASNDGSLDELDGFGVDTVALSENRGFAAGCNVGWSRGSAPYVLFLNPDAQISVESLRRLADVLDDRSIGAAGPRIVNEAGHLDYSQRRFLSIGETFAHAFFLHRIFPNAAWADGTVREAAAYARPADSDWLSGACLLVRREALDALGGFDEGFFMYCEDMDLCLRIRRLGLRVRYEPRAVAVHIGGASAPHSAMLPVLTASRLRYIRKNTTGPRAAVGGVGVAIGIVSHLIGARGGFAARAGYARALGVVLRTGMSRVPTRA